MSNGHTKRTQTNKDTWRRRRPRRRRQQQQPKQTKANQNKTKIKFKLKVWFKREKICFEFHKTLFAFELDLELELGFVCLVQTLQIKSNQIKRNERKGRTERERETRQLRANDETKLTRFSSSLKSIIRGEPRTEFSLSHSLGAEFSLSLFIGPSFSSFKLWFSSTKHSQTFIHAHTHSLKHIESELRRERERESWPKCQFKLNIGSDQQAVELTRPLAI